VVDSEDDAPVADSDDADLDESGSDESGSDDAGSDDADYDDADYDDDAPVAASDGPIRSNFEDAFKAELEAVHGDLGNAVSANRGGGGGGGGGRRRRGR
jgi:hypothetical protein